MPAAASAGSAEPASSEKAPPELSAMCKAVSPRGTDAGDAPYQACQDTLPLDPPLERQICPAVRAGPRNEGRRQTVNASLLSPDGGTGFTDSGKGNLSRRPPA